MEIVHKIIRLSKIYGEDTSNLEWRLSLNYNPPSEDNYLFLRQALHSRLSYIAVEYQLDAKLFKELRDRIEIL